jgi:glutamine amidotransferase
MCRWFAYISPEEPCLLSDVLITPSNSIFKQCSEHYLPFLLPHGDEKNLHDSKDLLVRMRNALLNMDGLGIAWYTDASSSYVKSVEGLRPAVYKSQSPPFNDFNFRTLCENTETNCVMAHIRASSGGAVTQVNCHPFVFGRHTFMHNGVVSQFADIKLRLLDMLCHDTLLNIHGTTDSEHSAALYMTNLTRHGTKDSWQKEYSVQAMIQAMVVTAVQLMQLQKDILGDNRWPNSLNFCATDGKKMVAIRFRNSATSQPPSLYWSELAGRSLNQKYPGHPDGAHLVNEAAQFTEQDKIGRHTIIASEPTTYEENIWKLIGKNCAFTVDEYGNELELPINYDLSLDAKEPVWPPKP